MDKKTWVIIGVLVVAVGALIGVSSWQNSAENKKPKYDYSSFDENSIIEPTDATGNLPENIHGSKDAPVVIYEYGNYQCTACAPMNPIINKLLDEYGDKVALVFRNMYLPAHDNATAAAAAANAAAIQGYWEEYKDLLFANQSEWFYSNANQRQEQFENYFVQVSSGKGDVAKFRSDMGSDAVAQKIEFDNQMADKRGATFTPSFYVEDEFVGQRREDNDGKALTDEQYLDKLRAAIDKRLEAKGIKKQQNK